MSIYIALSSFPVILFFIRYSDSAVCDFVLNVLILLIFPFVFNLYFLYVFNNLNIFLIVLNIFFFFKFVKNPTYLPLYLLNNINYIFFFSKLTGIVFRNIKICSLNITTANLSLLSEGIFWKKKNIYILIKIGTDKFVYDT